MRLTTLLVFVLASCSSTNTPNDEGAGSQTVKFMVSGGPEELAAYQKLIDRFKSNTPGIEIAINYVPGGGEMRQKLATMFSADVPPDVFLYNFRRLGVYASEGVIYPLDTLLDSSNVINREDFYKITLDAFTYQGKLQCLPLNLSSPVIYYNKALFDSANLAYPQAGWTWEDFVAHARTLTKDLNGDGATDQYGFGTEVETIRLAPFLWGNGGEFLDDLSDPTRLTIDMPEAREAIQWFVDLQVKEHVAPDAVAEEASSSMNRFLAGTLGMFMNSRVGTPTLRTIKDFDWDAAPLPVGKTAISVLHSDGLCVPVHAAEDPVHLQAVWQFIEFALSEPGQTILAETGRIVPSMKKVAESEVFLQSAPPKSNQIWLDAADSMYAFPIHPNWNTLEEMLSKELQRAYYGNATVDEIIDAANQAAANILDGN